MRGVIIEGVTGSGKSATYERLKRGFDQDSGLLLSQVFTQRLLEHLPRRSASDVLMLCDNYVSFLESIQALYESSVFVTHPRKESLRFSFIFESFHMNHILEFGLGDKQIFGPLEKRLRNIGTTVVMLKIPEDRILERSIRRTRQSRSARWLQYQMAFGMTDDELATRYKLQQRELEQWVVDSRLPHVVVDTSEEDWEQIAQTAARQLAAG